MARNQVNKYIDIVQTRPDLTSEELDKLIDEIVEEESSMTEWPDD